MVSENTQKIDNILTDAGRKAHREIHVSSSVERSLRERETEWEIFFLFEKTEDGAQTDQHVQ
jgi:hypothetical protein